MNVVPNLITLLRLALVPVVGYCILANAYAAAAVLFLLAALSDLADGYIARRFKFVSKLGALLDPIADKLNMFVAAVTLAWQELVPVWLAAAIVGRDVAIVAGVLVYRAVGRPLEMRPTLLSKANTLLEFAVLMLVLAAAANWIPSGRWLWPLFVVVLATVLGSAVQYTWLWSRGRPAPRAER